MIITQQIQKSIHLGYTRENSKQALYLSVSVNETGILYKMTAVLLAYGWEIIEVVAETSTDGYVRDIFIVHSPLGEVLNDGLVSMMENDLQGLFSDVDIVNYIHKKKLDTSRFTSQEKYIKNVSIFNPVMSDFTLIDIRTFDRPGLLFDIASCFYRENLDIISFAANTANTFARDSFLLLTNDGCKLTDEARIEKITNQLLSIV